MRFANGVYAQLTFKDDLSVSYHLTDTESIYEYLEARFSHDVAADAEGWAELACVGEWYETDDFEIEMMEV